MRIKIIHPLWVHLPAAAALVVLIIFLITAEPLPAGTLERLIPRGRMIVESRSRHCYFRPSPDGRRLLFGGRAAVNVVDTRRSARILHRLMTGVFPELATVALSHSWRGFWCGELMISTVSPFASL